MAIVTEHYKTREDGVELLRTYSDAGFMVEREGVRYSEAIDPADLGRQYTETDESIITFSSGISEADYQAALAEFGVRV